MGRRNADGSEPTTVCAALDKASARWKGGGEGWSSWPWAGVMTLRKGASRDTRMTWENRSIPQFPGADFPISSTLHKCPHNSVTRVLRRHRANGKTREGGMRKFCAGLSWSSGHSSGTWVNLCFVVETEKAFILKVWLTKTNAFTSIAESQTLKNKTQLCRLNHWVLFLCVSIFWGRKLVGKSRDCR